MDLRTAAWVFPISLLLAGCDPDAGTPADGQSVFFPHWTPATIELGATGPREIPLLIIRE